MHEQNRNKNNEKLRPFRCHHCGGLLAMEYILVGAVEIKCRWCKAINVAVGEYSPEDLEKPLDSLGGTE